MPSPLGRMAEFEMLSTERPQTQAELVGTFQRIDQLAQLAFKLGAHHGCRVKDDASGLEFRWRFT